MQLMRHQLCLKLSRVVRQSVLGGARSEGAVQGAQAVQRHVALRHVVVDGDGAKLGGLHSCAAGLDILPGYETVIFYVRLSDHIWKYQS